MSEYEPGTVAMVTHDDKRMKALCFTNERWLTACCGITRDATDIEPLVCLPLTRKDADVLDATPVASGYGREMLDRISAAIREQRPAPLEIPENLGAVVEMPKGDYAVYTGLDRKEPWLYTAPSDRDGTGASAWWTTAAIRAKAVKVLSEGVTHA